MIWNFPILPCLQMVKVASKLLSQRIEVRNDVEILQIGVVQEPSILPLSWLSLLSRPING